MRWKRRKTDISGNLRLDCFGWGIFYLTSWNYKEKRTNWRFLAVNVLVLAVRICEDIIGNINESVIEIFSELSKEYPKV